MLVWRYMTAIPLVFALISIITTMEACTHQISPVILGIRASIIGGSVLVCTLLSKVIHQMEQAVKAQEESEHIGRLLALQESQYKALAQNIEQTRAARHDLRHQLAAISTMVECEQYDKLREFVEQSRKALPIDRELVFCETCAANSVINHYLALAYEEGASCVYIRCTLASDSGLENIDLWVLLGNLLAIAIEGCKTVPIEHRAIKLRINRYLGELLLTVDNRFDGSLDTEHGELLSRKRCNGEKGIGLSSVAAIAQKYNGALQ